MGRDTTKSVQVGVWLSGVGWEVADCTSRLLCGRLRWCEDGQIRGSMGPWLTEAALAQLSNRSKLQNPRCPHAERRKRHKQLRCRTQRPTLAWDAVWLPDTLWQAFEETARAQSKHWNKRRCDVVWVRAFQMNHHRHLVSWLLVAMTSPFHSGA